jgi:hypothetical protein
MLFRTRDFLLFLLTVAFLVIGIASTIGIDLSVARQQAALVSFNQGSGEEVIYQAVLPEAAPDTRVSRITELKDKVAAFLGVNKDVFVETEEEVVVEEVVAAADLGSIQTCSNYAPLNVAWSPSNLNFEIVEGARIVYREVATPAIVPVPTSTSTEALPIFVARDVVLQLPLRTAPLANKTCLSSDVVGIALDGSLIRNNEQGLYGVFGESTLIGYALDGFPIYGLSKQAADSCGGSMSSGEYRYYLSSEREGILGCFSGVPTQVR